jgi:hypothetical protein
MIFAIRTTLVGLVASAALFFVGPATAGAADCATLSPTQDQYCPPSTINFQGNPDDPTGDPSTSADPSGGLPFTGYDVGLAALAAVGLVGAGIGLHRAARADEGA